MRPHDPSCALHASSHLWVDMTTRTAGGGWRVRTADNSSQLPSDIACLRSAFMPALISGRVPKRSRILMYRRLDRMVAILYHRKKAYGCPDSRCELVGDCNNFQHALGRPLFYPPIKFVSNVGNLANMYRLLMRHSDQPQSTNTDHRIIKIYWT